jgi:hypothetical protein
LRTGQIRGDQIRGQRRIENWSEREQRRTEQSSEQKKPADPRTNSKETPPRIAVEERKAVEDKMRETTD